MARAKTEVFEDQMVELAMFAKALGHPARIEILRHLATTGEQPCMSIVNELPLSQPACSRHINELLRVGLLESRASGTQILFRIRKQALSSFCTMMSQTLHPKGNS
jgi:ArsR family transcriptional regulator, arsenate/arsenite/antimonite-responsive transcriptional repressor